MQVSTKQPNEKMAIRRLPALVASFLLLLATSALAADDCSQIPDCSACQQVNVTGPAVHRMLMGGGHGGGAGLHGSRPQQGIGSLPAVRSPHPESSPRPFNGSDSHHDRRQGGKAFNGTADGALPSDVNTAAKFANSVPSVLRGRRALLEKQRGSAAAGAAARTNHTKTFDGARPAANHTSPGVMRDRRSLLQHGGGRNVGAGGARPAAAADSNMTAELGHMSPPAFGALVNRAVLQCTACAAPAYVLSGDHCGELS